MNINALPVEILHNIFKNLSGADVLECCGVCRTWKFAVEALSDEFWKKICKEDFSYTPEDEYSEVYKEAYRKANLSWRELYMTLRLWPEVKTADFQVIKLPYTNVVKFQVLADAIIGVPCNDCDPNPQLYNTIVYYDLSIMQEHHRTRFDTPFTDYAENDQLILLKNVNMLIDVTIKANNKRCSFEKHENSQFLWKLFDNEFYYQTLGRFYCIKLVEQNGEACLDSVEITAETDMDWRFSEEILKIEDITHTNSELVLVRTETHKILSIVDNKMKILNFYHNCLSLATIKQYGFRWSASDISNHIDLQEFISFPHEKFSNFTTVIEAACVFDKIVIVATEDPQRNLLIYYDPYSFSKELVIHKVAPDISVNLDAFGIENAESKASVTQIDVVEAGNGHNIIMLSCGIIYVIDVNHDGRKTEPLFIPKKCSSHSKPSSTSNCIVV